MQGTFGYIAKLANEAIQTELELKKEELRSEWEDLLIQKEDELKQVKGLQAETEESLSKLQAERESLINEFAKKEAALEKEKSDWKDSQKRERDVIETEKQAWANEKAMIASLTPKLKDVISLNVGGRLFSIKRTTLCQIEGSLLSNMFSGRWEDSLERDENNRIFLEMDPDCFESIVKWLRLKRIDPKIDFPHIAGISAVELRKWKDHLGLSVPAKDFEWMGNNRFDISGKSIIRTSSRRYDDGDTKVFAGPARNEICDIPSKTEFVCEYSVERGSSVDIGFCLTGDHRSYSGDTKVKIPRVVNGDVVAIVVNHIATTYSVELNGSLVNSSPKTIATPCVLSIITSEYCQKLTFI